VKLLLEQRFDKKDLQKLKFMEDLVLQKMPPVRKIVEA